MARMMGVVKQQVNWRCSHCQTARARHQAVKSARMREKQAWRLEFT